MGMLPNNNVCRKCCTKKRWKMLSLLLHSPIIHNWLITAVLLFVLGLLTKLGYTERTKKRCCDRQPTSHLDHVPLMYKKHSIRCQCKTNHSRKWHTHCVCHLCMSKQFVMTVLTIYCCFFLNVKRQTRKRLISASEVVWRRTVGRIAWPICN